jgi:hypothetical protein
MSKARPITLSEEDFRYAREADLDFARKYHRQWYSFHRGVERIAKKESIQPEVLCFQDACRIGDRNLNPNLREAAEDIIIASDILRLDLSTHQIAISLQNAISIGVDVSVYVREVIVDQKRRNPILGVLGRNIGNSCVNLYKCNEPIPADIWLVDGALQYFDPSFGFSPYLTITSLPQNDVVSKYARKAIDKLKSEKVDEVDVSRSPIIPKVTLGELVARFYRSC